MNEQEKFYAFNEDPFKEPHIRGEDILNIVKQEEELIQLDDQVNT